MRLAWLALGACVVAVVVTVLLTVPFPVLPGAHPHVDVLKDFTQKQIAREQAFHADVRPPAYLSLAVSLVALGILGLTRLGGRIVGGVPGHWTVKVVVGTAVVFALGQLATLPFDVQAEKALRKYGLSTQDWTGWTDDLLRGLGIKVALTSLALVSVLAVARRWPTTWWLPGAAIAIALTFIGSFAYPVVVEPAFNSFTKLPAGQLRTNLLALAESDHVKVSDVLVADASKRTTALNAYVSGFGSTRRIVVYDTLLKQASDKEVELVVAHELGHAKRNDVLHGTVIGAFAGAAGVIGLFLLLSWSGLLARVGARSGTDVRVVPLVLFLAAVAPLLLSPLTNLVSRHIEARADMHALDLTHDVPTYLDSERKLATTNLSDLSPSWLVYTLFYTHPSDPQRLALAREWQRLHP
ncbi:MAG: integral rane protease transrane protein [Frankiales bacterium]|nr:integral rane protease transrane protein [Frankiales bacterium]